MPPGLPYPVTVGLWADRKLVRAVRKRDLTEAVALAFYGRGE